MLMYVLSWAPGRVVNVPRVKQSMCRISSVAPRVPTPTPLPSATSILIHMNTLPQPKGSPSYPGTTQHSRSCPSTLCDFFFKAAHLCLAMAAIPKRVSTNALTVSFATVSISHPKRCRRVHPRNTAKIVLSTPIKADVVRMVGLCADVPQPPRLRSQGKPATSASSLLGMTLDITFPSKTEIPIIVITLL